MAPSTTRVDVVAAKPGSLAKTEPVSARLRAELVHPNKEGSLRNLAFTHGGARIVAAAYPEGTAVVFDTATGKQLVKFETGYAYRGSADYLNLSPDGTRAYVDTSKQKVTRTERDGKKLFNWDFEGHVQEWDVLTGERLRKFQHDPQRHIRAARLSPDGKTVVTAGSPPGVAERRPAFVTTFWDVRTGGKRDMPSGVEGFGLFSPNGQIYSYTTTDDDGYTTDVRSLDVVNGRELFRLPVPTPLTTTYPSHYSPDGRLLVGTVRAYPAKGNWTKWDEWLKFWDAATGAEVASFPKRDGQGFQWFTGQPFAPDGRTFAATTFRAETGKLYLIDVPGRRLAREVTLGVGEGANGGFAFSPDGLTVAVIAQVFPKDSSRDVKPADLAQPRVHFVDVESGTVRETAILPHSFMGKTVFSPDGKTLAVGGSGRVFLLDVPQVPGPRGAP